jgi:hypothetical protein
MELLLYLWIAHCLSELASQRCILVHQPFMYDIEDKLDLSKKYLSRHRLKLIQLLLNRLIILALLVGKDTITINIEFHGFTVLI